MEGYGGGPPRANPPTGQTLQRLCRRSLGGVDGLDRDTVRRVLRRASELDGQGDGRGGGTLEPNLDLSRIDSEALVAAAAEAGIAPAAVRRSLAVEALDRLGPPPPAHLGDRLLGASVVVVDHELAGRTDDVLRRLDAWLVGGHHLRRDRLRGGRGAWSRRRGLLGSTFRTVRHATGEGHLGELARLEAVACDTGVGTCMLRVAADRGRDRRVRGAVGTVVAGVGAAAVVAGATVAGPLALLAAPIAAGIAAGVAGTGRAQATDVGREIQRVLEAVDDEVKPSRLGPDLVRRAVGGGRPR